MLAFVLLALAAEPALILDPAPLVAGATATFRFEPQGTREGRAEVVYLDGCAPVELERLEDDVWKRVEPDRCDPPRHATRVAGPTALGVTLSAPGRYRAVVSWGAGCADGFSLELAGCARWGGTAPVRFEVRPAPPSPAR